MRIRALLLGVLLVLFALPSYAQVYYDMQAQAQSSGYRTDIYETVTASDFLRAPAMGFQRLAFTQGSTFAATVYACDTRTYDASTCTSVATLSATNQDISVTTGRMWLIVDVTTAETAGSVSYLTVRSHSTQHSSGGGAVEVLVGNVGAVADTANPNDADNDQSFSTAVACSDRCFFQASTTYGGGWWSWTGSAWSALNEQVLWDKRIESVNANWRSATQVAAGCIGPDQNGFEDSVSIGCSDHEGSFAMARSTFLTRWIFVPNQASVTNYSCEVRVISENPGTDDTSDATFVAGSSFIIGEAAFAESAQVDSPINTLVSAGDIWFALRDGGVCVGTGCTCELGHVDGRLFLLGIPVS